MCNKLKITIVLALLNWLAMTGPLTAGTGLTELVNEIRPAVVTVIVYDINQKVASIGSGFFIDKYGHLLTNYHVLDGRYNAEVKTADGNTYPIKHIVADNKAVDLVKVLVDIPRRGPADPIRTDDPALLSGKKQTNLGCKISFAIRMDWPGCIRNNSGFHGLAGV